MVAVVWNFETVPDQGEEFERFYGADGEWTKLSRRSRSFLGSSFLKDLARSLKEACGTGGAVKDRDIELQGDQRQKAAQALIAKGFRVKGLPG